MIREEFSHPIAITKDGVKKTFQLPYVITDSTFGSLLTANTNSNVTFEMCVPEVTDITNITYV